MPNADKVADVLRDGFHKHLDECEQCEKQTMTNMCKTGELLLKMAGTAALESLGGEEAMRVLQGKL